MDHKLVFRLTLELIFRINFQSKHYAFVGFFSYLSFVLYETLDLFETFLAFLSLEFGLFFSRKTGMPSGHAISKPAKALKAQGHLTFYTNSNALIQISGS